MSSKVNETMLLASRHAALDGIESLIHLSDECVTPHQEMYLRPRPYPLTCDSNVYQNPQMGYSTNSQLIVSSDWQQKQLQQHYAEHFETELNKFWSQHDQTCRLLCEVALQKDFAILRELETKQRMLLERDLFDSYQMMMIRFWEKKMLIQEIFWRDKLHAETLRLTFADEQREREVLKVQQEGSAAAASLMNTFVDTLHRILHERSHQTSTPARDSFMPAVDMSQKQEFMPVIGGKNDANCVSSTHSANQAHVHSEKEEYPFLKELPKIIREAVDSALSAQKQNAHSQVPESTTPPVESSAVVDKSLPVTEFTPPPSTLKHEHFLLFDKMQNAYDKHTEFLLNLCEDKMEWVVSKTVSQSVMIWGGLQRNLDVQTAVREVEIKYLQEEIHRLRSQQQVFQQPQNSSLESAVPPSSRTPENNLATLALKSEQMIQRVNLSTLPSESIFRNSYEVPYIPSTMRRPIKPPKHSFEELQAEALRLGVRPAIEPSATPPSTPVPTPTIVPTATAAAASQTLVISQPKEPEKISQPRMNTPSLKKSSSTTLMVRQFSANLDESSDDVELSSAARQLNTGSSSEKQSRQTKQNSIQNSRLTHVSAVTREDLAATENSSRAGPTERAPLQVKKLNIPIRQAFSASDSDDGATLTLSSPPAHSFAKRRSRERRVSREEHDASLELRAQEFADSLINPDRKKDVITVEVPPTVSQKSELQALTEMLVQKSQQQKSTSSIFKPSSEPTKISFIRDHTQSDLSISSGDISLTSFSTKHGKSRARASAEHAGRSPSHAAAEQPVPLKASPKRRAEPKKPPPEPVMRRSAFDDSDDDE